ncbi:hypothetical protein P9112_005118 [Eukaryota sp. TZLM1-RC]
MSLDSCVNAPFRNNNVQNYDTKRVAIVQSIIELENVNTALYAVNETESSSCADSCLANLLNVHGSDSPYEEPYGLVLHLLTKNSPSSKRIDEEGVLLDVE